MDAKRERAGRQTLLFIKHQTDFLLSLYLKQGNLKRSKNFLISTNLDALGIVKYIGRQNRGRTRNQVLLL